MWTYHNSITSITLTGNNQQPTIYPQRKWNSDLVKIKFLWIHCACTTLRISIQVMLQVTMLLELRGTDKNSKPLFQLHNFPGLCLHSINLIYWNETCHCNQKKKKNCKADQSCKKRWFPWVQKNHKTCSTAKSVFWLNELYKTFALSRKTCLL